MAAPSAHASGQVLRPSPCRFLTRDVRCGGMRHHVMHRRARARVCRSVSYHNCRPGLHATLFINRPKDVSGCSAAPDEFSFAAFLALFLFRGSQRMCVLGGGGGRVGRSLVGSRHIIYEGHGCTTSAEGHRCQTPWPGADTDGSDGLAGE